MNLSRVGVRASLAIVALAALAGCAIGSSGGATAGASVHPSSTSPSARSSTTSSAMILGPGCPPPTPYTPVVPHNGSVTASATNPATVGVTFQQIDGVTISRADIEIFPSAVSPEGPQITPPPSPITSPLPGTSSPASSVVAATLSNFVPDGQRLTVAFDGTSSTGQQEPSGSYIAWAVVQMSFPNCRGPGSLNMQLTSTVASISLS